MPIYEYRCDNGHTFEVMQRMTDDPVARCQTCEAPVQRVFHPIAVHFKGSGFYNTDYGTRKRQRETAAAGDGGGGKDAGGQAKKDSGGPGGGDKGSGVDKAPKTAKAPSGDKSTSSSTRPSSD